MVISCCSPSIAGRHLGGDHHDVRAGADQDRHPALRHVPAADDHHATTGEPQARGVRRVVAHVGIPADSNVAMSRSTAAAERTRGSASTAPLPSPSRRSRSTSGRRPSAASAAAWPGSTLRCPATQWSTASGDRDCGDQGGGAGDHAVQHHGHAARPRSRGSARPARRAPGRRPRRARRARRRRRGCGRRPRRRSPVLWASIASSMPVPRPVIASALRPGQVGDQAGGRGGVADPHVAGGHHVVPGVDQLRRRPGSRSSRRPPPPGATSPGRRRGRRCRGAPCAPRRPRPP